MSGLAYVAAWPQVVVHVDGQDVVVDKGHRIPASVPLAHASLLVSFGALVVVAGDPDPVVDVALVPPVLEVPKKGAPKAEWVDFAVAQGMPVAEASSATKDALIAAYSASSEPSLPSVPGVGDGSSLPGDPSVPTDPSLDGTAGEAGGVPSGVTGGEPSNDPQLPAKSAPKAEWVAAAVEAGWAAEDAETATKDELIDQLGG